MRRRALPALPILTVAVAAAMGLSVRNGFVYDDVPAIVHNSRITDPARWHTILSAPYWQGTLWRPLTVAGFAVQWWAGHGASWVFHVVSLLGYLALTWLLVSVLRRLEIDPLAALLAAVLFAVHPVHVEVVANVVGQSEIWAALAMLSATAVYVHARNERQEQRWLLPLLVLISLGIMAKESGFVVPALLAGAEVLLVRDTRPWYRRCRMLVPVIIITAIFFGVRALTLHDVKGEFAAIALRGLPLHDRVLTFLGVVPEYLRLLVWPAHLQADYSPPGTLVGGPFALRHTIGALIVVTVAWLTVASRRRAPLASFGLWWGIVGLAPLTNVITASGLIMAERALFLPSIGCAMALAAGLGVIASHRDRLGHRHLIPPSLTAMLMALAVVAAIRSERRVPTWSSQERFFADLATDAPTAYFGWKLAAEYAHSTHDDSTAIADYQHSLALWPHDEAVFEQLGQIYRSAGHCDLAVPLLEQGIAVRADDSSLRAKLVECLMALHRWDDANRYAQEGVALGQAEFTVEQARIVRFRDSTATP